MAIRILRRNNHWLMRLCRIFPRWSAKLLPFAVEAARVEQDCRSYSVIIIPKPKPAPLYWERDKDTSHK